MSYECCICLDPLETTNNYMITCCNHRYHVSCILNNVQYNGFCCPYCRTKLVDEIEKDVLEEPGEESDDEVLEPEVQYEIQDEVQDEAQAVILTEETKLNINYIINNKIYEIYYGIYIIKLVLIIIISLYLFGETPSYKLLYFAWCVYHILNLLTLSIIIWVEYNRPDKLAAYVILQNQMANLQHVDHFAGTLFILHILRMKI